MRVDSVATASGTEGIFATCIFFPLLAPRSPVGIVHGSRVQKHTQLLGPRTFGLRVRRARPRQLHAARVASTVDDQSGWARRNGARCFGALASWHGIPGGRLAVASWHVEGGASC